MRKQISKMVFLGSVALFFLVSGAVGVSAQEGAVTPELTTDDCIKCHKQPPVDIAAQGGKHKTNVSCMDCHVGHPPSVRDNIPLCSNCHEGLPHFKLENCLGCHSNPHTPLNITLSGELTAPCLTCHTEQIAQLKEFPSKHSSLACSQCHSDKHGRIPVCMECHSPHSNEMTMSDCVTCHQVHKPLMVTYPEDIPNKSCGACHDQAYALLQASKAKHSQLQCATCHQAKHKMVPQCQMCHGVPHPEGIMAKFPSCGGCHNIAHDLNSWPSQGK
jgi:hypothetical protein